MKTIEGWQTKPFGAVIKDIGDGGTPNTNKKEYFGGTIPWVVIQDICKEISSSKTTLTPLGLDSCSAKLWPAGSVILSTGATIGEVGLAKVPVSTKQGIHGIVCSDQLSSSFLYYKLQTLRDFLKANSQGSTIREVRATFLRTIPISFPTALPEQIKIAEILSTVDRAIEQTEALIVKQQRIKTGLMQDLLTRGIDEHGNLRSEQTHEFKDSPLGRIPVEWEVKRLGKLLANINQGWSPDCNSEPASIGEWGVLKTTSVEWQGYFDYENKALPERLKPRSSLEILYGDLLMTRAGPNSRVGVVAYVYHTRDKLMLSDKIYRLIPAENMDGRFLCYALSGFETQKHLSNYKTGMAESQTNISQEIVINLLVVVPNKREQAKIADRLDQMSSFTKRSVETLEKLRSLKTAFMQDLFTGKKRVTALLTDKEKITS